MIFTVFFLRFLIIFKVFFYRFFISFLRCQLHYLGRKCAKNIENINYIYSFFFFSFLIVFTMSFIVFFRFYVVSYIIWAGNAPKILKKSAKSSFSPSVSKFRHQMSLYIICKLFIFLTINNRRYILHRRYSISNSLKIKKI